MRSRDSALRALATRAYPGLSRSAQAKRIRCLTVRYAASAWRSDQSREEMPWHYAGKPQELLWRAFKSGAAMPLSERQLRNILA